MSIKKIMLLAATPLLTLSITACHTSVKVNNTSRDNDKDNGKITRYVDKVGSFTSIDCSTVADVVCKYVPDSTGYVVRYSTPKAYRLTKVSNSGGKLTLGHVENGGNMRRQYIIIYASGLTDIENSGVGSLTLFGERIFARDKDIDITNSGVGPTVISATINGRKVDVENDGVGDLSLTAPLTAKTFKLESNGVGKINFSAPLNATTVDIESDGVGSITTSKIVADNMSVDIAGTGSMTTEVNIRGKLKVEHTGVGSLTVTGYAGTSDISKDGVGRLNLNGFKNNM